MGIWSGVFYRAMWCLSHTQLCSGLIPGCALRDHSWGRTSGDKVGVMKNQTLVTHLQSKHLNCSTISLTQLLLLLLFLLFFLFLSFFFPSFSLSLPLFLCVCLPFCLLHFFFHCKRPPYYLIWVVWSGVDSGTSDSGLYSYCGCPGVRN